MRLRRRHKKNIISFKTLVFSFVITLLLFSVGYSLLSQNFSITGTANLPENTIIKNEFRSENLLLTYDIGNGWYTGGRQYYQYNFTLENVGTTAVADWKIILYLPTDYEFVHGWEAEYESTIGELTITGNPDNNRTTLNVGQSITFGLQFSSIDQNFDLTKVKMEGLIIILGEDPEEGGGDSGETGGDSGETGGDSGETGGDSGETGGDSGETGGDSENDGDKLLDITYTIANSWENGSEKFYQIDFSITNNSDKNLSSWQFNAITPEDTEVIQSWNCNYVNADGVITISSISNYGDLIPGGNVKPGIIISMSSDLDLKIE